MGYDPNGSEGLNDFADQILLADEDSAGGAAVTIAAAVYRVGAQLVDTFHAMTLAINKVSEQLEYIQLNLADRDST